MAEPFAPRLVKPAPAPLVQPPRAEPVHVIRELDRVIQKETTPARGWRFVPRRDENNLIVEIIATPIE